MRSPDEGRNSGSGARSGSVPEGRVASSSHRSAVPLNPIDGGAAASPLIIDISSVSSVLCLNEVGGALKR